MKFNHIQQFFFFGLLILTTTLFLWMLGEYLLPVFWAIVLAIVFYPLYLKFSKTFNGRNMLASLATVLSVILIVVIPLSVVGGLIVQESLSLYQSITESNDTTDGFSFIDRTAEAAKILEPFNISQEQIENKLRENLARGAEFVVGSLYSVSQVTFAFIIHTGIMLYLLFFMFKDGSKLQEKLIHFLPLGDKQERKLLDRFSETTRAVVKGTLAIAIIQGALGGVTFWITGVSAPVLWGVAMALLAIIPAIGPALIWFPAAIILLLTGSIWQGVTILVVGTMLVSVVDEFLRPILVGRGAKMPDALVLLATIGGLATFGISGFVIGPIIAAFFLSLWFMFEEKYHTELSDNK